MKPLLALAALLALSGSYPAGRDPLSDYIGNACRTLHDAPVREFSGVGVDGSHLELRCSKHRYRAVWVKVPGW